MHPHILWLLLLLTYPVQAAFIQSQRCGLNNTGFKLHPLVVDAALDEKNQILKFLVNSVVVNHTDITDLLPRITDIDSITNTYTTLHIEVEFMGQTFINENKRFCELIAVYREPTSTSSSSTVSSSTTGAVPVALQTQRVAGPQQQKKRNDQRDIYGDSNKGEVQDDYDDLDNFPSTGFISDGAVFNTPTSKNSSFVAPFDSTTIPSLATENSSINNVYSNSTGTLIQCPLYVNDSIMLYYEANISSHFHKLGSYTVRFLVISNTLNASVIGCNVVYVTPVQADLILNSFMFGAIGLLIAALLVNTFTIVCSLYQELSNPFMVMASTICNENLLKQMDATFPRIILYLQFALFISGLDLQYPGFYQPLIGKLKWCALLGYAIVTDRLLELQGENGQNGIQLDNIYRTYNNGGLNALTRFASSTSISGTWQNFMLCFLVWLGCQILVQQVFLVLKLTADKLVKTFSWNDKKSLLNDDFQFDLQKNACLIAGQALYSFLLLFSFPFIVLTSFMFSIAGDTKNRTTNSDMKEGACNFVTTYEAVFGTNSTLNHPSNSTYGYSTHPGNSTQLNTNYEKTFESSPLTSYSKLNIVFGLLLFAFWLAILCYFLFKYIFSFRGRNKNTSKLYTLVKNILLWHFFYHHYNPNKLIFVAVDYANILIRALIIGCLQYHGLVQVILLIIVEFSNMALLVLIRPHFIKVSFVSSIWILPLAKFLVTTLCIAYIKELGIGESTRTYVSYAQLMIHAMVAVLFMLQLIYGFTSTLISIIKGVRAKREGLKAPANENGSTDDLINSQFEYKQIHTNPRMPTLTSVENVFSDIEIDDEDLYFRAKSQKQLSELHKTVNAQLDERSGHSFKAESLSPASLSNEDKHEVELEDGSDFSQQQLFSDLRKRRNDYRVREGDNIYKKFLLDESIDPEVKAMWDARNLISDNLQHEKTPHKGYFSKLSKHNVYKLLRPQPAQMGFQVDRPKRLVVRTVEESRGRISSTTSSPSRSSSS